MDWFIKFRSPMDIFQSHPSFLACELVTYMMGVLTLLHALRNGGRLKYLWLATIFHGLTVESVSYFVPDIDNFWHAQSMVMFLGQRLPLHIIAFYPAFLYTASVSVSKMNLKWWAEPFAVGLAVVLLDVPFDIMGIKLLWWTWHDTDPNIFDRHYWVPWTSYYFHATFALGFTVVFHGSHYLMTNIGKFQSAGFPREITCSILTGLFSMPLGVLQFIPVYHTLHDSFGIHTEPCVLFLVAIFTSVIWLSDRRPLQQARSGTVGLDELGWITFLHYSFYIILVFFEKPDRIIARGLHQTVGPCEPVEAVNTPFGHVLSKKKFLCLEDYDEGCFDFHCVKEKPISGSNWYTICGNDFPNHMEYICVVTAFSLFGFLFYYQANFGSGKIPLTNSSKKIKTK